MSFVEKRLEKYSSSYLSTWMVLLMDTFLSTMASFSVIAAVNLTAESNFYSFDYFAVIWMGTSVVASLVSFLILKSYTLVIRHTSFRDVLRFALAALIKAAALLAVLHIVSKATSTVYIMVLMDFALTLISLMAVRLVMIWVYEMFKHRVSSMRSRQRVLVYGTGDKSAAMVTRLINSPHYDVVGFLLYGQDKDPGVRKLMDKSIFVVKDINSFESLGRNLSVAAILFVNDADLDPELSNLIEFCSSNGIRVLVAPPIDDASGAREASFRKLRIEDLLGREEIKISTDEIKARLQGKTVLVTGAAGSIGSEICRQLASFGVLRLIMFDNAETPMHELRLELEQRYPGLDFVPVIGDVRFRNRLDYVFSRYRPQVVYHASAYKHVPLMEENPCEAVMVNVGGSRNVADMCLKYGVKKMVMISTDKAVNPTNVMGCSKRLAEIYVQSLGLAGEGSEGTRFVTTRFGNVLGSNGSVIPRFRKQIANGGPITVTHPEITRYFMTIPEACRLVLETAVLPQSNCIFVFDMGKPVKIVDLARKMIKLSGFEPDIDIKIVFTGLRPGEKLYEEVLSTVENSDSTSHYRIRIAKVRPCNLEYVVQKLDKLEACAEQGDVVATVKMMKEIVPEFKSMNSEFEKYD
ncbi:MAG: polysaccharide biosynthesis protein [Bacteroidales bacterium]|nr:polysaccharide biosynthesis protein [Bacteroidales bacterium]